MAELAKTLHTALAAAAATSSASASSPSPQSMLQVAHEQLKRPVWVWTDKSAGPNVYQCDDGDHDPLQQLQVVASLATA